VRATPPPGRFPQRADGPFLAPAARRERAVRRTLTSAILGAVLNLNHPAHTVNWEFIHMSVANVVVIALMLIVFALAIVLPFPGAARRARARGAAGAPTGTGGASPGAAVAHPAPGHGAPGTRGSEA
jgi:hypothetical protein